ncbi:MAG: TonB-dependent receptor [Candidatus Marinimicrobia bacterium]|nr:TonB-dependent receptor [Candidatus Neomarinimicrobiota bacterium]MCF7902115.1 TonB-dependent receptor [Candidatus Neomarinimicrobiota bacterium]
MVLSDCHHSKIGFVLSLFLLLGSTVYGQGKGSISGQVVEAKTSDPLPGVNILVQNTFLGTTTGPDGYFQVTGLSPGNYTITVSIIGYRRETISDIPVVADTDWHVLVALNQDVLSSPQVVVTSSRKTQDILESPVTVSVISARQIQEQAAINLVDILPYEPGISTVNGQLNIRGASGYTLGAGSRSLILLDGIPLLGSAAGNVTWQIVPTSEIEQVEIVKAGGSALYGSSAMGGVVNIITRSGTYRPETRLRLKSGAYSNPAFEQWNWRDGRGYFYTAELSHARSVAAHNGWFRVQRQHDDGYNELDWYDAVNLTGKVKLNFGTHHSASVYANFLADNGGLSSQWRSAAHPFEAPVGSEQDRIDGTKFNLNAMYNYIYSPKVVLKTRGALYQVHWQDHGSNTDHSSERKLYSDYQLSASWTERLNTIAGLTFQHASIDADIFGNHNSLSVAFYFLAQQQLSQKAMLSLGSRWEQYSVDGKFLDKMITPQFAFNYRPARGLAFRTSVGWGFRVPTIAEMFTRSQLSIFKVEPNPDLTSESSISYEVGSTWVVPATGKILDQMKLDVAVFQNDYDNLIEPTPDANGIIHFENITKALVRGAEAGVVTSLLNQSLTLSSSYTYLDPVALDDSDTVRDTLAYRYRHQWVSTIGTRVYGVSVKLEYRYASRMEQTQLFQEDPRTGQDRRVPIHVWNAGLGYSKNNWDFLVRLENLLQYYYVELERNMGPERNLSLAINYRF